MSIRLRPDYKYVRTDQIICPYCDYVQSDSWEYADGAETNWVDCGECGKGFEITIHYDTSFTSHL